MNKLFALFIAISLFCLQNIKLLPKDEKKSEKTLGALENFHNKFSNNIGKIEGRNQVNISSLRNKERITESCLDEEESYMKTMNARERALGGKKGIRCGVNLGNFVSSWDDETEEELSQVYSGFSSGKQKKDSKKNRSYRRPGKRREIRLNKQLEILNFSGNRNKSFAKN